MGMRDATEQVDIYGLPVYKITKIIKERIGDEVHMICGHEMFGQTIWTHVAIILASDLIVEADACQQIAMRPMLRMNG